MVTVSNAFKAGLISGAPQRMIFVFEGGTIITNEDIDVDSGVDYDSTFCSETDLTVGLTPSSEIHFTLLNDDGHYTNFTFGEFSAYIGVRVAHTANGSARVQRPAVTMGTGNQTATVSGNGYADTFDLCPLGRFIAPRPNIVRKNQIAVDANDQMTLFEDYNLSDLSVTYPVTAGDLLAAMAAKVGITMTAALTQKTFLNAALTMMAQKSPETYDLRTVLGWIAEAACAQARFNREGDLDFVWFNPTSQVYDESTYTEYEQSWFLNPTVEKLHVRNEDSTAEAVIGTGDNAYLIQNNPFLRQSEVSS